KITWQSHRPFNLYTYHLNKMPYHLPYRLLDKAKRSLSPQKYIERNWELQFLGTANEKRLQHWLFDTPQMKEVIPKHLSLEFYDKFKKEDAVYYSHAVSMLLTLSLFFSNKK